MPGLKSRRNFCKDLVVQTPSSCPDVDSLALHAKYIVSNCILGQGISAVVRLGQRKEDGQVIAVKESRTNGDEELCETMRKEFELMRPLTHPHIVRVYDFYRAPNLSKAYLCMECVQGTTLKTIVKNGGKVAEMTMCPLFQQLASAVSYLHGRRIIHRDLKPDNILVRDTMDTLLICDFGCACDLKEAASLTCRVGAMSFAAPEMLLGQGVTGEQTDIWSAGLCLYYALSGGSTPTSGKYFASVISLGEYLARATPGERHEWISFIGLSNQSLVAQVLWACLSPDPTLRPNATLLLAHPWLCAEEDEDRPDIGWTRSCLTHGHLKPKHLVDVHSRVARWQRLLPVCARTFDSNSSTTTATTTHEDLPTYLGG